MYVLNCEIVERPELNSIEAVLRPGGDNAYPNSCRPDRYTGRLTNNDELSIIREKLLQKLPKESVSVDWGRQTENITAVRVNEPIQPSEPMDHARKRIVATIQQILDRKQYAVQPQDPPSISI